VYNLTILQANNPPFSNSSFDRSQGIRQNRILTKTTKLNLGGSSILVQIFGRCRIPKSS